MAEELTVLAEAGAAALVTAMATDLWQGTREAVVGLFRRADRGQRGAVEVRLDRNAALVRAAASPDAVRRALFAFWAQELAALLRQAPSCREPLAQLAGRVSAALSEDHWELAFD
ncbi:hypothetical protein [Kitasatospora kifunensis]|uniref:Uncharacterized protein n=1 Tax=Kitasatospora kifunensis TaxID=58351 RepID=A0A7W7QXC5_KITKI|nr:hypothetical protein [Kitasatospora kifunensis]MBB4921487.1 hypothetical protein [Kitasatospora kifunensis]